MGKEMPHAPGQLYMLN